MSRVFYCLVYFVILFFLCVSCGDKSRLQKDFKFVSITYISGCPCLEVNIEDRSLLVELDTGSSSEFNFRSEIINSIKEQENVSEFKTFDIHGNIYRLPALKIPLVKMGTINFYDVTALQESEEFLYKGSCAFPNLGISKQRIDFLGQVLGRVGSRAIHAMNYVLLDFPGAGFYLIRDLKEGIRKGVFDIKEYVSFDFEYQDGLIVIFFVTDLGLRKFILDTGADFTVIRSDALDPVPKKIKSEKFVLNNVDMGPIYLQQIELTNRIKADGILGFDFLKNHALYLDFKTHKGFISPPKKSGEKAVSDPSRTTRSYSENYNQFRT